jgi:NAD(P)-dependent dehydrogenase (short-subunit alcohol dehydrogenase family)
MDLRDAVVVVTGATGGIGRAAARRFAGRGARLALVGRDRERGRAAMEECRAAGGEAVFLRADLADGDAVRALADVVRERYDRLDVLVNNAAVSRPRRALIPFDATPVEATFAVNHLAPYLLTRLLLDRLRASAPARVVTTASAVHRRADLDLEAVTAPDEEYDALAAYARSKLANVAFSLELADRLAGTGVHATAVHPGFVPGTGLYRDVSLPRRLLFGLLERVPRVGSTAEEGGARVAAVAAAVPGAPTDGAYVEEGEPAEPAPAARDPEVRAALWTRSAALAGLPPE